MVGNVRGTFAAVWTEWIESRHANGIDDLEPSREELVFFLSDLSEERLYVYIQQAMEGLDMLYSARAAEAGVLALERPWYTLAPFGDEWLWDSTGAKPWVTRSLEEAVTRAKEVADEYDAAMKQETGNGWEGFWSQVIAHTYNPARDREGENPDAMVGWVDPAGEFHKGFSPPLDPDGGYRQSAFADSKGG